MASHKATMSRRIPLVEPEADDNELSIINVVSISMLQEAAQVEDLMQAVAVSLHDRNIVKVQAFELCPNLRILDLSFNLIKRVDGLACLSKLVELKMYDNQVVNLSGLATITSLVSLDVSGNKLVSLQGLAALRSLRTLRCAHNPGLTSLEGLGKGGLIEMLDASHCALPGLGDLAAAISLTELCVDGNKISSLRGLQRCDKLTELRVAHNQLSSLQGLRACAATLDMLDVRGNGLTSLEGLAEKFANLHELFAAGNKLKGLGGLTARAPALELLDVAGNQLSGASLVPQLVAQLSSLEELTWVRLDGNPGWNSEQRSALMAGLPELEGVDDEARPVEADVWQAEEDAELHELLAGVDVASLQPTVEEMETYKRRMGITSQVPLLGRPGQPLDRDHPLPAAHPGTASRPGTASQRPGTASQGPGTASQRPGSSMGRPGTSSGIGGGSASLRASATGLPLGRPGTASGVGSSGVRDVMMHQRPPSARTGGSAKLITPDQYAEAVASFADNMGTYSARLRSVLTSMKAGLKLDMTSAASVMRTPEGAAARQLPIMPHVPSMPPRESQAPSRGPFPLPARAVVPLGGHTRITAAAEMAVEMAAKREAMRDPGLEQAMDAYHRLYPPTPPQNAQRAAQAGSGRGGPEATRGSRRVPQAVSLQQGGGSQSGSDGDDRDQPIDSERQEEVESRPSADLPSQSNSKSAPTPTATDSLGGGLGGRGSGTLHVRVPMPTGKAPPSVVLVGNAVGKMGTGASSFSAPLAGARGDRSVDVAGVAMNRRNLKARLVPGRV